MGDLETWKYIGRVVTYVYGGIGIVLMHVILFYCLRRLWQLRREIRELDWSLRG